MSGISNFAENQQTKQYLCDGIYNFANTLEAGALQHSIWNYAAGAAPSIYAISAGLVGRVTKFVHRAACTYHTQAEILVGTKEEFLTDINNIASFGIHWFVRRYTTNQNVDQSFNKGRIEEQINKLEAELNSLEPQTTSGGSTARERKRNKQSMQTKNMQILNRKQELAGLIETARAELASIEKAPIFKVIAANCLKVGHHLYSAALTVAQVFIKNKTQEERAVFVEDKLTNISQKYGFDINNNPFNKNLIIKAKNELMMRVKKLHELFEEKTEVLAVNFNVNEDESMLQDLSKASLTHENFYALIQLLNLKNTLKEHLEAFITYDNDIATKNLARLRGVNSFFKNHSQEIFEFMHRYIREKVQPAILRLIDVQGLIDNPKDPFLDFDLTYNIKDSKLPMEQVKQKIPDIYEKNSLSDHPLVELLDFITIIQKELLLKNCIKQGQDVIQNPKLRDERDNIIMLFITTVKRMIKVYYIGSNEDLADHETLTITFGLFIPFLKDLESLRTKIVQFNT